MKAATLNAVTDKAPEADLALRQARSRRARNIAIGLVLGAFVLLVYAVTVIKLGPGAITNRPL